MTRTLISIFILGIALASCKQKKGELLVGTWHAVKLENATMDSFFANSQGFIDTMGKNSTADANLLTYGTTNMDSLRQAMQQQLDSVKAMQQGSLLNTTFDFRSDSMAVLSFNGNVDSAKWRIEEQYLVLEDKNRETAGDKLRMQILTLDANVLKLKFEENGAASLVTFRHDGK